MSLAMAFIPGGQGFAKLSKIGSSLVKAVDRGSDIAKCTPKLIKEGTTVFRAGGKGMEHGQSYTLKSLEGKTRSEIITHCGIPTEKTGNPVTHLYEYRANQNFRAKSRTSIGGDWPELVLDPGQGEKVLDLVRIIPSPSI